MKFTFKHSVSGEIKIIEFTDKEIQSLLEDELIERASDCDCQPIGETNVVECNCDDYYCDFILQDRDTIPPEPVVFEELHYDENGLMLSASYPITAHLILEFTDFLAKAHAQNFLTMNVKNCDHDYEVTIRKKNGKTPAERIKELEAKIQDGKDYTP